MPVFTDLMTCEVKVPKERDIVMKNKAEAELPSIYWLGGSTCAGKTTISNILAKMYGFAVYHCDEHLSRHIERSDPRKHPNLNKATVLDWNKILQMKEDEYLNWMIGLFTEEYDMIVKDLKDFKDGRPILVEGANLLPWLIWDEMAGTANAVWLIAEEAFYRKHQVKRPELFDRIKKCEDPEQALQNYLDCDLAFGKYIKKEAQMLGLKVVIAENESDLMKNIEAVSANFNLK